MKFDLKVPATLRDIKLSQWQKYAKILDKNKDVEDNTFVNLKTLEIFCGMSLPEIKSVPLSTFDGILEHISAIFNAKTPRVNTFKLIGTDDVEVEFGMIPNLDKMSYGEYEDLEKYIFDEDNLHRAMAVLYRPLMMKKGDRYLIHPYKGTNDLAEVMKDTPLDAVFGARVFFYNLAKKLGVYTMDYTLQQLMKEKENLLDKDLEKNGEVTKQSIRLHKEMLAGLKKLQHFHYTNA